MSQQINLFNKALQQHGGKFSTQNMLQGLAAIIFLVILFYAYLYYQTSMLGQQLQQSNKSLATDQQKLAGLIAEFSRQRAGLSIEQELKKLEAEAIAQREIIASLKSGVIGNTKGYSEYMQAFARQVVTGLWLTGFSIDDEARQMSMSGAALKAELVPGYIMRLNNEKVMRGKTFASLQMSLPKTVAGSKVITPHLEFVLQSVDVGEADK